MADSPGLTYWFETPLVLAPLPGAGEVNALLAPLILERATEGSDELASWGGAAAAQLRDHAIALAGQLTEDIGSPGRPRFTWTAAMSAIVLRRGASLPIHCRAGAYWSALYFVDDGNGDGADPALGGAVVLEDPRMPMMHMRAPHLRFRPPDGAPPDEPEQQVRPLTGGMLMFPGWLRHGITPYQGAGQMIAVELHLRALLTA